MAPLSLERPKGLLRVRGEILIERQIRQLQAAGIAKIYVVTGYKREMFAYLQEKFGVALRYNPAYASRNNHASIRVVRDVLANSYICSSDIYYSSNPFESMVSGGAYYAAVYAAGSTEEWCLQTDAAGIIRGVTIGGHDAWIMQGHSFWDAAFSNGFLAALEQVYDREETRDKYWETIYLEHVARLRMRIRKYPPGLIHEFDTVEELRRFEAGNGNR